jgi:hypothetical protein
MDQDTDTFEIVAPVGASQQEYNGNPWGIPAKPTNPLVLPDLGKSVPMEQQQYEAINVPQHVAYPHAHPFPHSNQFACEVGW